MSTTLVGLLGYPVEHSLSPAMHNAAFRALDLNWRYILLPVEPHAFGAQIELCLRDGYAGWNITVPHKERMVDYLDSMSAEVEATGACNTVRVEAGRLVGFNTDIGGFITGLEEAGGVEAGSEAVILGAGGAARAVAYALATAGHNPTVLARNAAHAAHLTQTLLPSGVAIKHASLDADTLNCAIHGASLLVNTTPAGMWPHTDTTPLPVGTHLPEHLLVYDLVYRPRPTRLLTQAAIAGCRTQDGLSMLVGQGAAAFTLWTGHPAPRALMLEACLATDERPKTKD